MTPKTPDEAWRDFNDCANDEHEWGSTAPVDKLRTAVEATCRAMIAQAMAPERVALDHACDECGDDDPLLPKQRHGEQWLCPACAPPAKGETAEPSEDPREVGYGDSVTPRRREPGETAEKGAPERVEMWWRPAGVRRDGSRYGASLQDCKQTNEDIHGTSLIYVRIDLYESERRRAEEAELLLSRAIDAAGMPHGPGAPLLATVSDAAAFIGHLNADVARLTHEVKVLESCLAVRDNLLNTSTGLLTDMSKERDAALAKVAEAEKRGEVKAWAAIHNMVQRGDVFGKAESELDEARRALQRYAHSQTRPEADRVESEGRKEGT